MEIKTGRQLLNLAKKYKARIDTYHRASAYDDKTSHRGIMTSYKGLLKELKRLGFKVKKCKFESFFRKDKVGYECSLDKLRVTIIPYSSKSNEAEISLSGPKKEKYLAWNPGC